MKTRDRVTGGWLRGTRGCGLTVLMKQCEGLSVAKHREWNNGTLWVATAIRNRQVDGLCTGVAAVPCGGEVVTKAPPSMAPRRTPSHRVPQVQCTGRPMREGRVAAAHGTKGGVWRGRRARERRGAGRVPALQQRNHGPGRRPRIRRRIVFVAVGPRGVGSPVAQTALCCGVRAACRSWLGEARTRSSGAPRSGGAVRSVGRTFLCCVQSY